MTIIIRLNSKRRIYILGFLPPELLSEKPIKVSFKS